MTASEQDTGLPTSGPGRERVGRYELCFEIAAGGMATVYLARSAGPGGFEKLVALKFIHRHLASDPTFVDMFLDEARIAARIDHANVCSVFDFGEVDGNYYLTMEYLVGEPLTRVVQALSRGGGGIDLRIAGRLLADICEGLHAAHELKDGRGQPLHVVHRDVSPQNLFVTYDGIAKVVDFGVASARYRVHQTETGHVKGKYAYMAPEQLQGEAMDRRADVWSLGVVLWELVTGERLFKRDTQVATINAIQNAEIPRPSRVRSGVPAELDRIVLGALAPEPRHRYPNARQLGRDLNRALAPIGGAASAADVADWMRSLFPDREARQRQLMELAHSIDDRVPRVYQAGSGETSNPAAGPPEGVRGHGVLRRGWKTWVPTGAAVLVAAVAGLAGGVWSRSADRTAAEGPAQRDPVGAATHGAVAAPPRDAAASPPAADETRGSSAASEGVAASGGPDGGAGDGAGDEKQAGGAAASDGAHARSARGNGGATASDPSASATEAPARASDGPRVRRRRSKTNEPGRVNVVTPGGWAFVFRNGRRIGEAPGVLELPPGRHALQLQPFGQGALQTVRVRVRSGELSRLSVPLGE